MSAVVATPKIDAGDENACFRILQRMQGQSLRVSPTAVGIFKKFQRKQGSSARSISRPVLVEMYKRQQPRSPNTILMQTSENDTSSDSSEKERRERERREKEQFMWFDQRRRERQRWEEEAAQIRQNAENRFQFEKYMLAAAAEKSKAERQKVWEQQIEEERRQHENQFLDDI